MNYFESIKKESKIKKFNFMKSSLYKDLMLACPHKKVSVFQIWNDKKCDYDTYKTCTVCKKKIQ